MSIFIKVDLPAPFGPSSAQIRPVGISNDAWATATSSPKCMLRPRQEINNDLKLFQSFKVRTPAGVGRPCAKSHAPPDAYATIEAQAQFMLVVMQEGADESQIQRVIDRLVAMGFIVHRSTGVMHTVLGGVGPVDDFDPTEFEVMEGVKECHRIVSPYKLASRHFRPGGTVVKISDVEIGGNQVVVMAGPCSVENRDQIEQAAEAGGARTAPRSLRGGAFKPRTLAVQLPGPGRRRASDDARGGRPASACWWSAK